MKTNATTTNFSPAENRVLLGYLEGLQGKEIAAKMCRSYNTVIRQTASMFQKANVHSIHELVSLWYREQFGIELAELKRRCGALVLLIIFSASTFIGGADDDAVKRRVRRRRDDEIEMVA